MLNMSGKSSQLKLSIVLSPAGRASGVTLASSSTVLAARRIFKLAALLTDLNI